MLDNKFFKNIGINSLSIVFSQACNTISILLIAKILSQHDFGLYSIFQTYINLYISINLLSFDKALPNIQNNDLLSFLYGIFFVHISYLALSYFVLFLVGYGYCKLVSACVFFNAVKKVNEALAVRSQQFNLLAYIRIIEPMMHLLFIGWLAVKGTLYLEQVLWVYSLSTGTSVLIMLVKFKEIVPISAGYSLDKAWKLIVKERGFALLTAPSEILNRLAYYSPMFIINNYFGPVIAGQYNLMLRFCFSPISIISSSIGQVFQSYLAKHNRESGSGIDILTKVFLKKLLLAFIGCLILFFIVLPETMRFVFGEKWGYLYWFLKFSSPMFSVMAVVSPLTSAFYVFRRNIDNFIQQGSYLLISFFSFFIAVVFKDIYLGIILFSMLSFVRYLHILSILKRII